TGGNLEFDQDVFDDVVASDADAVRNFFLDSGEGAANSIEDRLDSLTDVVDGLFTVERNSVQSTIESLTGRIEQIDSLLEIRQERLLQEFIQMESIIGQLQSQGDALTALSQIATQQKSSN
ncbi:MAG: flagellar filament capping protein FliD, partial [Planctomycetota bacterium]